MLRFALSILCLALLPPYLFAQTQVEGSVELGVSMPNSRLSTQMNGNYGGGGVSSGFFNLPWYATFMGTYLNGEVYDVTEPYDEKIRSNVSFGANLIVRTNPEIPMSLTLTYHQFKYSGFADILYYPFTGGEESWITTLFSDLKLFNAAFTVGYETQGLSRIGLHIGPVLQFQKLSEVTHDMGIFQTSYYRSPTTGTLGVQGNITIAQALNPRDDLTLTMGAQGASINLGHQNDGFFNITPYVHIGYRHSLTKVLGEEPRVPPAELFMNGIYSGCYGYDPERKIDSLLHLLDSLGEELNDAVKGLEDNGFTKEVRALEALLEIARLANSSGGLSQAGMSALGDYIQCNDTALVTLIKSGTSGAGQVIKGMKFLKDILEFIAENNKHITASEKKLLLKIVKEIGDQLDKLEKALDDKNVDLAISILKTIKEGLPDGWPNDLLDRIAKGLLKELEDAIAEAGPKAVKKILETILKKLTGSGAAAASLAEDAYNFIDLLYRLAVYYDALEEFNEAFVNLLEELKANGKGLSTGLSCLTDWGGQDKRITKLVTEFELVCWCPEEPGSKTDGEWKSTACEIEPSDATNPHQHTHPIGAGSFGSKNYKVHFPEDRPCDSKLCYLKHTVYGYDRDGNLIQKVSTFLGVAN